MIDALRGLIQWTPLGLPAFLFVITVVVFFHELGHFLVARAFGVKVDVFSVGFGKEIVGFNDRRGTRWRVSWLPIGGYVKFAGDANAASAPDPAAVARMSPQMRAQTLALKPVGQRALVAAAGPFANFILAIVMLTGLLMVSGHVIIPPVVGFVAKDSPAAAAGIKPGDRVTAIDGDAITDFQDLPQIISMSGGENLAISLQRHGHTLTVHAVPHLVRQKNMLGEWESSFVIGIGRSSLEAVIQPYTPLGAFQAACSETWDIISTTLTGVVKMAQGHASPDQVQGAIGIGKMTQKVAEFGFLPLLNLVAILSVSIGLANLFPIPLLDGGHLLYYGFEAVLRRPLGERAQELGFRFGVVLVVGLLVVSAIHDLSR